MTTRDGKVVQEHFGHARYFHIVCINDDDDIDGSADTNRARYHYVETREIEPRCQGNGVAADGASETSHGHQRFAPVLELLKDCDAVVTAQIGPGAAAQVLGAGLRIFEARGFVDDILNEIIDKRLLDDDAS
jgi:predicted Fe-Mo cluster-binding NifX family protein